LLQADQQTLRVIRGRVERRVMQVEASRGINLTCNCGMDLAEVREYCGLDETCQSRPCARATCERKVLIAARIGAQAGSTCTVLTAEDGYRSRFNNWEMCAYTL
jgi:hypothetical protein